MKINEVATIQDAMKFKAVVKLETPTGGYWDGGRKDYFEFTPEIERTPGKPAIRWGCYDANCWFVVEFKNAKQHFAALKRKLKGQPSRRITFVEAQ